MSLSSKTPTQDRLRAVEAELKKLGPLTALTGGTFYLRLSKREAELAAAKKTSARAIGTPSRATGIFAKAATPAAPPPPPKNVAAAVAGTDAELYDFWCSADRGDSNLLSSNPDAYARIRNESHRRHFKR
jgi:hypothetical protein